MKPDLEQDLLQSDWIKNKCKTSKIYDQNLYAALCNNRFFYGEYEWTCSWRHAGGIVSEILGGSNYMDYYCSGMVNKEGIVPEGSVTDEIRLDLLKLGWIIRSYDKK